MVGRIPPSDGSGQPTRRVEIERKFLVPEPPGDLDSHRSGHIEQGYLAIGEAGEVRLRRVGDELTLTVKRGMGEVRDEEEVELAPDQFDSLWPLTEGLRVTKTRHWIPAGERTIELDVYEGPLEGLITAEVEFPSDSESRAFDPPAWFGDEVTDDDRYKNEVLARDGIPG
jgi:adenylate cyclase